MKPRTICFNFSPSPFCKHDELECHSKSLDIDDLKSAAQSLNPIVTLAMVALHHSSSQFALHAKSLKDTMSSWIFCLSMMFKYFFTNCNWIFENLFLRPFVHLRFWNFCSQSGLQFYFLDELLNFFSLNVVEIFVHKVLLIFFLMICFSNLSLVYLGNLILEISLFKIWVMFALIILRLSMCIE